MWLRSWAWAIATASALPAITAPVDLDGSSQPHPFVAGGRTVGLISHVEAMQEDIPAGLHVERLDDGSSRVRSRIPSPA